MGWGGVPEKGISPTNLSFSLCVVCALLIYAISINIICVSQQGRGPVEPNQQIYDVHK